VLLGQFIAKVATKNRIAVPAKFRQELGQTLIVSQGFESSLIILSKSRWLELVEEATIGPFTAKEVRDISRFLLAGAVEVELDDQGRFVLPGSLKNAAAIGKTAVFIGLWRWVELWDLRLWQRYSQNLTKIGGKLAQKLKDLK